MKLERYRFERQVEKASLQSQEWLRREYRDILESQKDFTRKADYIGLSISSIDDKVAALDEEIKELQALKRDLKDAKEVAAQIGAEIFQEYGIEKIEGTGISSITLTKPTIKTKLKLQVHDQDALVKAGYFKMIIDEEKVINAFNDADERSKLESYCNVEIEKTDVPSKLKINKRRSSKSTSIEKVAA